MAAGTWTTIRAIRVWVQLVIRPDNAARGGKWEYLKWKKKIENLAKMENGGFGKVKWSWFWWEGKWKVLGGDGRTMGCLQGSDALPSYAQGKKVTHGQCPMLQSRNIEGETKLFKCNLCKRQNLLLIRASKCYNILPSKTAKFNALDI